MAMNQFCFAFIGKGIPQSVVYQTIKNTVRSPKAKANEATFSVINTCDLKDETVAISNEDIVILYNEWAKPLLEQIHANGEESIKLAIILDALLPRLMSREIDVSNIEPSACQIVKRTSTILKHKK